jgi:hypothetical protein
MPNASEASPANVMEKIMVYKKYVILGVGVIALLVTAYVAYGYFTGISSAITEVKDEATTLNNSLKSTTDTTPTDTSTADKAKLNNVVNELKDQYKTDTPTTPPGMKIDLSTSTADTTAPDDTTTPAADPLAPVIGIPTPVTDTPTSDSSNGGIAR